MHRSHLDIAAPDQSAALLAMGLADADANVRTVATTRLRQLRAEAAPAAKELAAALADSDPRIAEGAAQTLVAIGEPAVEPLVPQLAAKSTAARKLALAPSPKSAHRQKLRCQLSKRASPTAIRKSKP